MVLIGNLTFKEVEFMFIFENDTLKLVPNTLMMEKIELDWFDRESHVCSDSSIYVEDDCLHGRVSETNKTITFLPDKNVRLGITNGIISIKIKSYFFSNHPNPRISRIEFHSAEINYIHPINQAVEISYKSEEHDGIIQLETKDFESTTTGKEEFIVNQKQVKVWFGISRITNFSIEKPPLLLQSAMIFEFNETSDYNFISKLHRIAIEFIQFLCYRRNIQFDKVLLRQTDYRKIGEFKVTQNIGIDEIDSLKKEGCIKQARISGSEGRILNDIATNQLYMRHIPKTYEDSLSIDAASFVLIMTAFEWEFNRILPAGIPKSKKREVAEKEVSDNIQRLIDSSSGELRKIYKTLKKSIVPYIALSVKIERILTRYEAILRPFGENLYSLNNATYVHSEIGSRLAKQRNNFAHGNLDKEFIAESLLDVIFMKFVVVVMQLSEYGVGELEIQKSINELFRQNLLI